MNGYWFGTYSGSNSGRMVTDWQHIADRFPGVVAPKQAEVVCQWSEQRVALTWRAEIRTHGSVNLLRSQVRQPSVCEPLPVSTWEEFRRLVEQREQHRYIYRGQEKPWRLCTPFHRTGRGDTRRFMAQDIPALHHRLSAFTRRVYNLVDPTQRIVTVAQTYSSKQQDAIHLIPKLAVLDPPTA